MSFAVVSERTGALMFEGDMQRCLRAVEEFRSLGASPMRVERLTRPDTAAWTIAAMTVSRTQASA